VLAVQNMLYDLSFAGTRGLASAANEIPNEQPPADGAVDNDEQS
jgi:hypothetical protein